MGKKELDVFRSSVPGSLFIARPLKLDQRKVFGFKGLNFSPCRMFGCYLGELNMN